MEFMTALNETEINMPQIEIIRQASKGFFISGMILYGISLLGVSLMRRLKKAGFHIYTGAQVLIAFQPWLFLNTGGFPLLSLMASAIFIILYGVHLKYMT